MTVADVDRVARGDLQLIDTDAEFDAGLRRIEAGHGPIAVDTERASGFRYTDRAYLVQVFRRGSGSLLLDPIALPRIARLQDAFGEAEWVLHAASQDLPCLRELGLAPLRLFDTELASRLLGKEHVGLGAVVEELLGVELAKAHSADDWSLRPLPAEWLAYAALDVEYLVDVRDLLEVELRRAGKLTWALEEFEHLVVDPPLHHRGPEAWRRLHGLHSLRTPRRLAVARSLWLARDDYARERDRAPGRILPDRSIVAAATALPSSRGELAALREFTGRESRTELDRWWSAVTEGVADDDPPSTRGPADRDRLPQPRMWRARRPDAAARLNHAKARIAELAERLAVPHENLLTPDFLRRCAWEPDAPGDSAAIAAQLRRLGAREWQISITAPVIADAFVEADQASPDDPGSAR